jgi:hypothetical protein
MIDNPILRYGEIYSSLVLKQGKEQGEHIEKTLFFGAIFLNGRTKYAVLSRDNGKIRCYHFTKFDIDNLGVNNCRIIIRDAVICPLLELEREFAEGKLKERGL